MPVNPQVLQELIKKFGKKAVSAAVNAARAKVMVPNMTGTATSAGTALRDIPKVESTVGKEAAVAAAALASPAIVADSEILGPALFDFGKDLASFEAIDNTPRIWGGDRLSSTAAEYAGRGVRAVLPDAIEEGPARAAEMITPFLVMAPEAIAGRVIEQGIRSGARAISGEVEKKLAEYAAKKDWKAFKQFAKDNGLGIAKETGTGNPVLLSSKGQPLYLKDGKLVPYGEGEQTASSAALKSNSVSGGTFNPNEWDLWLEGHPNYWSKAAGKPSNLDDAFPYVTTDEADFLSWKAASEGWSPSEYWSELGELNKYNAAHPVQSVKNDILPPPPPEVHNPVTGVGTSGVVDQDVIDAIKAGSSDFDIDKFISDFDLSPTGVSFGTTAEEDAAITKKLSDIKQKLAGNKKANNGPALIDIPSVATPSPTVTPQSHLNTVTDGKIMKTLPNISVKTPGREQVDQILRGVKEGTLPPLETQVFDYFGRPINIPEWWAAAMRTDTAKAAYPEGVDYLWRGFNSKAANASAGRSDKWMEIPTGYASLFGGDHNLASDYTAHFNTRAPSIDYSTSGGIPNLMLFTVPKGKIYDVGNIGGQRWNELYRPTPQNNALKNKFYDEVTLRQTGSQGMPYSDYEDLMNAYNKMRADNPFVLNGRVMRSTDDIADFLSNPVESTPGFDASGVVLRNIHDGMFGDEVIWNIGRGGSPKLVHPGNSFEFDLANRHWLKKSGGKIHIDPSKRGTFKAQASRMGMSVKQAASHILAHPENYSPAMRKKANFARNFAEDGGPVDKGKKPRFDKPISWYVSQKPEMYPTINKIRPEYLDKYFIINDAGQIVDNTARNAFVNRKKEVRGTTGSIPYNQDNEIMLTTSGANARYRTGRISTDLLDYIYDNAAKAGIPFRDAVGLAGKESTLGIGRGYKRGASISPIDLYSFWNGVGDAVKTNKWHNNADKLYKSLYAGEELNTEEFDKIENEYRRLYDNLHEYQGDNLVKDAYDYYKAGKYNPGEKGYDADVIVQGDAILSDPAVQKWLKTKKTYNGRGFTFGGTLDRLKKVYGDDMDSMLAAILRAKNVKKQS